ncbi:hypothetical protein [Wukongibacter sp. M2B1]|uniref:hypothetical protein n=1 Tax=Wukongibacter sp. M2B1 TaxID=3088895 RepID=UPI003D7A4169
MKKKSIVICLILILAVISISSFALNERKTGFLKGSNETENPNKRAARQEATKQIEEIILDAWTDIEDTFNIDINKYYVVTASDSTAIQNYFGEESSNIFFDTIAPLLEDVPEGSIVPVAYIRHDKKEILFCYKDPDGTNVMKTINLNDNFNKNSKTEKIKEIKKIKGKPQIKLDKEKIKEKMED